MNIEFTSIQPLSLFLAIFALIFFGILMFGGGYFVLSSRYPTKKFLIFKKGIATTRTYRTNGTNVMEGGLFQLLTSREKKIKESLNSFETIYMSKGFGSVEKVYVATEVKDILLPMRIKWTDGKGYEYIQPEAVNTGLAIAKIGAESDNDINSIINSNTPLAVSITFGGIVLLGMVIGFIGLGVLIWLLMPTFLEISSNMLVISETLANSETVANSETIANSSIEIIP